MCSQSPGSGLVRVVLVTGTNDSPCASTTGIAAATHARVPSTAAATTKDLFTILASGGILRHYRPTTSASLSIRLRHSGVIERFAKPDCRRRDRRQKVERARSVGIRAG